MGDKLDKVIGQIQIIAGRPLPMEGCIQKPTMEPSESSDDEGEEAAGHLPKYTLDDIVNFLNQTLKFEKQKAILDTLYFDQLEDREWAIPEAHKNTFGWVFEGGSTSSVANETSATFIEWLQHGEDVFWVTGKAGSGKSTLMKFLTRHNETKRLLGEWAGNNNLIVAQHYFWSPGNAMQKSQEGLLRALLHQILRQRTSLMRVACPDRWNAPFADSFSPWSRAQLIAAFEKLGRLPQASWKVCLFIDGLDEYSGDHDELVQVILRMGELPRIKICAASRPWIEFSDAFENKEWKLYLHDLSQADIHTFVRDELQGNKKFQRLRAMNKGDAELLALEIVTRAQGVFLWVFLVVRSLLDGLTNEDDIHDLWMRLRTLPTGLKNMFKRMLDTIDEFYVKRTSRLFLTMTHAETSFPVLAFYFMEFDDRILPKEPLPFLRHWPNVDMSNEWARALDRKKRQLVGQCKDLIFISPVPDAPDLFNERVGFLHRTVVDYIKSKDVRTRLQCTAEDFSPDRILLGAHVGQLRSLIHQHRNNYIRPHLAQWLLGALYYARKIEGLTGAPEVEALDDLEAIIMSNDDWNEDAPESSFLELVCRYDVALYVCSKVPDLSVERLDELVPNWKARISINRDSGFELCQSTSEDNEDKWRLLTEARASSSMQTRPAEVDLPTATMLDMASPPKISIVVAKERFEVEDNVKRKRGRFASKLKGLFRKR
ncbi:high-affinity nicotinic acid transporter [Colletotrichum kahawae]|uniref:High-affinity nicotinic acid transporter n=1 Tax=Colletotrichum kahawae TaxID=34407 RepID=A0AAD9YMH6_COLKA|nr:high-affinity nicotinic acid transporter [Colletotrichum kahawae]